MTTKPTLLFLMGPTASGKTALASAWRARYPIEIISVDSAMIYRDMNIGTAKPTSTELAITPHRLIDIKSPAEIYSAADFRRDALAEIDAILAQNKTPLLVGGTMLYFKALLDGLSPLPAADASVRKAIEKQAAEASWQSVHERLKQIDPESAARIHPNDPQRLSRALEVYLISGKTLSSLMQIKEKNLPYRVKQFAICPASRVELHSRIEHRFRLMLDNGFENEVKYLAAHYQLHNDLPSMRCVGYRQMLHYLSNNISYDEMVFQGICATRQLAKRQLTWLRKWPDVTWLDSDNVTHILPNF